MSAVPLYFEEARAIWVTLSVLLLGWLTCCVVTQLHRIVLLDQLYKYSTGVSHYIGPTTVETGDSSTSPTSTSATATGGSATGTEATPTATTTEAGGGMGRVRNVLDPMAPICIRYMRWSWATRKLSELVVLTTVLTLFIQFAMIFSRGGRGGGDRYDGDGGDEGKWPNPKVPDSSDWPDRDWDHLPGAMWVLFWLIVSLSLAQILILLFRHPEIYLGGGRDRHHTHGYRSLGTSQLPMHDRYVDSFGDYSSGMGDSRVTGVIGNPVGISKWMDAGVEVVKWILVLTLLILVWVRI